MPETTPVSIDDDLRADLDAYFAVTTAAEMTPGVARISAASLGVRRRPWWPRAMRPATALVGAAVVVAAGVVLTRGHEGPGTAASDNLSAGSGSSLRAAAGAGVGAVVTYPGVDGATVRATLGITFADPSGHGRAAVSPAQAQATAITGVGNGGTAGPALLTWAELTATTPPSTCLCWLVKVVAAPGSTQPSAAATTGPGVLVLVDATTDAVVLKVSGPGVR